MKPVSIIGGGLAGLSLGISLRKKGVPVTLYDAGSYPRHRVCGEFICGIRQETLESLDIAHVFKDAHRHSEIAFFHRGVSIYQTTIPRVAFGISRFALDARLAQIFEDLGGILVTDKKMLPKQPEEAGWVWAAGRHVEPSPWLGLKMHFSNLQTSADLELHLGNLGYAGLSAVENGRINVCGLFRKQPGIRARKHELLTTYLESSGLGYLADRLRSANPHLDSALGISSVRFHKTYQPPHRCHIGDHYAVPPPFTGNGMSFAIESAALASGPIQGWSANRQDWSTALKSVRCNIRGKMRTRLIAARLLHPWIYNETGQACLALLARSGLLPFRPLFLITH